MRIALLDPYLDTMSGGEKYMLSLALCLSQDHEVTLLWDKTPKDEIIQRAKNRFAMDLSVLSFKPSFLSEKSTFHRLKKSLEYDRLIILSDGSIPLVRCPLIIHFQSPMNWVHGKSLKNKIKFSRVRKVICNSQFTKRYIDKTYGIKCDILYPPVQVQRPYSPSKKQNIILNVGRFGINHAGSSFKKQDMLAQTFIKMKQQSKNDWQLVFIMSVMDNDQQSFEAFKQTYLHPDIIYVSNPQNEVLWDNYEKASIYWHASGFGEDLVQHPDRAEHFGISTVEAMGVGAVPIVINAGGQKEIVDHGINGYLWNTEEELMRFTDELIHDKTKRETMIASGIEKSQKFSLDEFCSKAAAVIK